MCPAIPCLGIYPKKLKTRSQRDICVFYVLLIYFERERERTRAGEEQREGDRESQAGSRLPA